MVLLLLPREQSVDKDCIALGSQLRICHEINMKDQHQITDIILANRHKSYMTPLWIIK